MVKDYSENHVSRNTQMTPKEAEKKENQAEVKEQLESIRRTDNPQARIAEGDKVRVIIKKKFEKGYMPDWSDEIYTVQSVSKRKRRRGLHSYIVSTYNRSPSYVSTESSEQHSEQL